MKIKRIHILERLMAVLSRKHMKSFVCIILSLALLPTYPVHAFSSIDIEQKLVVMKEGDTFQLSPSGLDPIYNTINGKKKKMAMEHKDIKITNWKSNNTKVATVSNKGKVTAKKSGTCVITATYGKLKATSKIRVYNENQFYDHMVAADLSFEKIYTALTANKYSSSYDLFYDATGSKGGAQIYEKAARKAKSIIQSTITADMSDYEKMMAIAAWLAENIKMDNESWSGYFSGYDRDSTYMDGLLYGKCSDMGIGILFDILLNLCGIQSEYMIDGGKFNNKNGETEHVADVNIVKLDGDYYYFDFLWLRGLYEDLDQSAGEEKSFYDALQPDVYGNINAFEEITTFAERADNTSKHLSPRFTYYSEIPANFRCSTWLGYNLDRKLQYEVYYYDFYTGSVRYINAGEIDKLIVPYFASYGLYPDFVAEKYKVILGTEMAINGRMTDLLDTATEIKEGSRDYDDFQTWEKLDMAKQYKERIGSVLGYKFQEEVTLTQAVAEISSLFDSKRAVMKNRAMIRYLDNKMAKLKALMAELPVE